MNDFGGTVQIESRFPSVNAMGKAGIDKPAPKGVHHVLSTGCLNHNRVL